MIARLPTNILHATASTILSSDPDSSKSWFVKNIRHLCRKYSLPSPLQLLQNPPSKNCYKKLIKSRILDYWETHLRAEAAPKPSLIYFKPSFMSLSSPHPMFTTCGSNSFETNKSTCQAALISGRFKTDLLARHWVQENPEGHCVICPNLGLQDTLEHFLITCNTLMPTRETILNYWYSFTEEDDVL